MEFIENLLQWAQIQLQGGTFEPGKLNVHERSWAVIHLLDPELRRKDIVIENDIQQPLYVYADKEHDSFRIQEFTDQRHQVYRQGWPYNAAQPAGG